MNRNGLSAQGWIWAAIAGAITASGCGGGTTATGTGGHGSTSASTGSTGTGGHGTGGAPGTGGSGGGAACVDGKSFASLFTIKDSSFCAVAVYTADEVLSGPTWGSHDGPLSVLADMNGGVTIERWTAPGGAMGALTKQTTSVAAMIPAGAFLGAQAIDLPFFGWTAISYTGAKTPFAGQLIMIKASAVDTTYALDGAYAIVGLGTAAAPGRALFTAETALGASVPGQNGLYAADACALPMPELGAGTGCAASALVAAWGEASGPIAVDRDGNAFSVLSSFSTGMQEARGFAAATVAKGAAATAGATLFTVGGFGSALAAITPAGAQPGLLVFQPFDATTFAALDVIEQPYTTGAAVAPQGAPTTLLTVPPMSMTGLSFMTDGQDRLWVAGAIGTTSTTFVVLERKH